MEDIIFPAKGGDVYNYIQIYDDRRETSRKKRSTYDTGTTIKTRKHRETPVKHTHKPLLPKQHRESSKIQNADYKKKGGNTHKNKTLEHNNKHPITKN